LGAGGSSGIPLLWGTDAVHGHNNIPGATIFPHNIGPGATRDPALIRRIDEITALEVRVTGLDWAFSPSAAVARKAAASPRCCSAHLAGRCATTSRAGCPSRGRARRACRRWTAGPASRRSSLTATGSPTRTTASCRNCPRARPAAPAARSQSAALAPTATQARSAFDTEPRLKLRTAAAIDRKSTRLNSSHVAISYAVFCLKKKKKTIQKYIGYMTYHCFPYSSTVTYLYY